MLLFFIVFIFFMLHIQFLVRNLLFGLDESTFFFWTHTYLFDKEVAQLSLFFTILCVGCFAGGYMLFYRKRKKKAVKALVEVDLKHCRGELFLLNFAGIVQAVYGLIQIWAFRFDYQKLAEAKMAFGFVYELRIFFLILLAHLLLNVPWLQIIKRRELRSTRWVVVAYILITLLGQARSALFEIVSVLMIARLMWVGDKVKLKYVVFVVGALLVPNLIVLGRLGKIDDWRIIIDGLFSFEYSIMFNNMLGSVISHQFSTNGVLSFVPSLLLLIPSPLRAMYGISIEKSSYYLDVATESGVFNGGFSFLAEMFSNFGWYAPVLFGVLGLWIGGMNLKAARVGHVNLFSASAPLLYVAFILAFRNDLGVFIKYALQLFVISSLLNVMIQNRLGK